MMDNERAPILVTRAQPGATQTAVRLRRRGYSAIVSPVLDLMKPSPAPIMPLGSAAGLIFTSANGVRFFAETSARRDLPAWCVGPATTRAAKAVGFSTVHNANGDSDALFAYINAHVDKTSGPLIHVANSEAAGRLADRLREAGYDVLFAPLYHAVPAEVLSQAAERALTAKRLDAVLIHSAKGAQAFAALAGRFDLSNTRLVAVSAFAADPARKLNWQSVTIALRPNELSLLAALEDVVSVL